MSQNNSQVYAALVIACIALALSIVTAVRGPGEARATGPRACIDQEARQQTDELRRALAQRDALVAQLARAANTTSGAANTASGTAAAGESPRPETPPETGPRRFTHFEIPNPAVTVTQKDDGTYDIRTTDPALSGTVMQITAVTQSGEENKLLIRIP